MMRAREANSNVILRRRLASASRRLEGWKQARSLFPSFETAVLRTASSELVNLSWGRANFNCQVHAMMILWIAVDQEDRERARRIIGGVPRAEPCQGSGPVGASAHARAGTRPARATLHGS